MAIAGDSADRTTRRIRRIARIWSAAIIGFTLFMVIAHIMVPDTEPGSYPSSENLLPLAMCLSVAGLGVAWRWEGLGGAINVVFFLLGKPLGNPKELSYRSEYGADMERRE